MICCHLSPESLSFPASILILSCGAVGDPFAGVVDVDPGENVTASTGHENLGVAAFGKDLMAPQPRL